MKHISKKMFKKRGLFVTSFGIYCVTPMLSS